MQRSKIIYILSLALLLLFLFPGCVSEQDNSEVKDSLSDTIPTLHLYLDTDYIAQNDFQHCIERIPGYGEEFTVEINSTPSNTTPVNEDRETIAQHERIEVVAGSGSDIYFCKCTQGLEMETTIVKGTFPYPEAVMKLGFFLPLDEFISNASYMELEKMNSQVMAAGKNEQGQFLIPLTFSVYATLFDKNKYSMPDVLPSSWEQQTNSEDIGLKLSSHGASDTFVGTFGRFVDYSKGELLISKEELQQHVETYVELGSPEMRKQGEIIGLIAQDVRISPDENHHFPDKKSGEKKKDYVMVPMLNSSGGATAYVTSFAAINKNTLYPDFAFRVVDYLASKEIQQQFMFGKGMPIYSELGKKGEPLGQNRWTLSEWNYEQYSQLCNQIDTVFFRTEIDLLIAEMLTNCVNEPSYEKRQDIISKTYTKLQMIVGEL